MATSSSNHRNSQPSTHRYTDCRSASLASAVEAPTQVRILSLLFGVPQRVASPASKRTAFGAYLSVVFSNNSSLLSIWSMVRGDADLALAVI